MENLVIVMFKPNKGKHGSFIYTLHVFLVFQMWLLSALPPYLVLSIYIFAIYLLGANFCKSIFLVQCSIRGVVFFFNVKSSTVLEINLPFWRKKSISALIKVNSLYSNSFLYLTMHEIRE